MMQMVSPCEEDEWGLRENQKGYNLINLSDHAIHSSPWSTSLKHTLVLLKTGPGLPLGAGGWSLPSLPAHILQKTSCPRGQMHTDCISDSKEQKKP